MQTDMLNLSQICDMKTKLKFCWRESGKFYIDWAHNNAICARNKLFPFSHTERCILQNDNNAASLNICIYENRVKMYYYENLTNLSKNVAALWLWTHQVFWLSSKDILLNNLQTPIFSLSQLHSNIKWERERKLPLYNEKLDNPTVWL
jgi:hypothetical protein